MAESLYRQLLVHNVLPKLDQRQETFDGLRRVLRLACNTDEPGASLWSKMGLASADADTKNQLLATVARELEFSVVSMCTSLARYRERSKYLLKAIREMTRPGVWVGKTPLEYDETQDVVDTMKRVSANYRQKTTGRSRT